MRGDSVRNLHRSLIALGFKIPSEEQENNKFGSETRDAIIQFQEEHNIPPTGIVDEKTSIQINQLKNAGKTPKITLFKP